MAELRSGAAVFRTGSDGVIAEWNDAAEQLTGISADEATGRSCWEVIRGRDDAGHLVCHPGCSIARLARQGWPVQCTDLHMATPRGTKRVTISTIVVRTAGEPLVLHPLREQAGADPQPDTDKGATPLTPRQREILALIAGGMRAREIAARLVLSETTVRNHIRAILLQLGVHSQLEAVARARSLALVRDEPAA
jgi:DNA-binding CsgD family transcriptional regulator